MRCIVSRRPTINKKYNVMFKIFMSHDGKNPRWPTAVKLSPYDASAGAPRSPRAALAGADCGSVHPRRLVRPAPPGARHSSG